MKDEIVIAQAFEGEVRIHAARTTKLVEEARQKHHLLATSAAALGRTLTVTAIMASDLKDKEASITSIFNGHGPAGTVLAKANGNLQVKGYISDPNIYLVREDGHLDVGKAIGTNGELTVSKDLGLKEPFYGMVKIQTGEVGDDFAYYFATSEQTPSIVSVGVLVEPEGSIQAAGGLIIQLLPNAKESTISSLEALTKTLPPMTKLISEGKEVTDIIHSYFSDAKILAHRDVAYHCGCSKAHYRDALKVLPKKDIREMIDEGKEAEIVCAYCNTKYTFDIDELKEILNG